jgi:hypothetical protein
VAENAFERDVDGFGVQAARRRQSSAPNLHDDALGVGVRLNPTAVAGE